jgi:UDP-N-acetylmuramoyl-tripeptide--D-alanyl-D-alanine ligase
MRALDAALPSNQRGGHAATVDELIEILNKNLRPDDVVTVKGSHGSRMYEVVAKLVAASASPEPVKG